LTGGDISGYSAVSAAERFIHGDIYKDTLFMNFSIVIFFGFRQKHS